MITQTDARSITTTLTYDGLNRLTGKTYSDPATSSVTYTYDSGINGVGRRTGMSDGSGSTTWEYDARGRLVTESKVIDGETFTTSYTYNSADQTASMTYPDGETVNYAYTQQGLLNSMASSTFTYLDSISYDEAGRMTAMSLGSGTISKSFAYYAWTSADNGGLLSSLNVQNAASQNLLSLNYDYDKNANVTQISSSTAGETSSFTYDSLDRLTSMIVNDGTENIFTEAFAYDAANGNLLYKGENTSNWAQYAYEGDQPHAVTSLSGTELEYTYDDNGNMVTRVEANGEERTLTYDAENNLVEVIGPEAAATPLHHPNLPC